MVSPALGPGALLAAPAGSRRRPFLLRPDRAVPTVSVMLFLSCGAAGLGSGGAAGRRCVLVAMRAGRAACPATVVGTRWTAVGHAAASAGGRVLEHRATGEGQEARVARRGGGGRRSPSRSPLWRRTSDRRSRSADTPPRRARAAGRGWRARPRGWGPRRCRRPGRPPRRGGRAAASASSSTGLPWQARRTPRTTLSRLNGSVTPLRLTTASTASSTVVNRLPHGDAGAAAAGGLPVVDLSGVDHPAVRVPTERAAHSIAPPPRAGGVTRPHQ